MALKELITLNQGLDSGLWPYRGSHRPEGVWDDGRNVYFRHGGVTKMDGWSTMFTTGVSTPIIGLGQMLDNQQRLFFANYTNIYMWNTSSVTQVGSGYTCNTVETVTQMASLWLFEPWGSWMLATNGVNPVQVWKGSGTSFTALANTTFNRAEIILRKNTFVLAMNTNNGWDYVEWCASDNPEEWTQSAANSAGALQLRDLESGIICAVHLGDSIAVISKDQMQLLRYIGPPTYFGYTQAVQGIGAVSKRSCVSVGRLVYGLGIQGFWVSDGVTFSYIDEDQIRKWFQDTINWDQKSQTVCYHDELTTQVVWYVPNKSGTRTGIGYDYVRKTWTFYDAPGVRYAIERQVFSYPVLGDGSGNVFVYHYGSSANGSSFTAYATTKAHDLGYPEQQKWIQGLKLDVEPTHFRGPLWFRIGLQERLDDSVTWSSTYTVSSGHELVDVRQDKLVGRWIKLQVGSVHASATWLLTGLTVFGKPFGRVP